jgi:hypothetical protein
LELSGVSVRFRSRDLVARLAAAEAKGTVAVPTSEAELHPSAVL